ncbi:MAG: glycoside hydrolase family 2 protein, partial [Planctomycetes bacterium]|nr:glycoside hydrolase family 2 protein [Planctomycetota bacterium]
AEPTTVGPWRSIRCENGSVILRKKWLHTSLDGTTGVGRIDCTVASCRPVTRAVLNIGNFSSDLKISPCDCETLISGETHVPNAPIWWPHTHGTPSRLSAELEVHTSEGVCRFPMGNVGFRTVDVRRDNEGFEIIINGEPVFIRGACWTTSDIVSLNACEESLRHDLTLVRDAGANMLRVGGTMVYESDRFYELCDELGLLVWQDFMFANMDYPVDDPQFRKNIEQEVTEQLSRLASHPSVAIYCGSSEIEQQVTMLGLPIEYARKEWFVDRLPELCNQLHPGTSYVTSTPTGGVLPFHANKVLSHFYGIGAYCRSLSELRQADVKFSPECVAFAHLPEPATVVATTGKQTPITHSATWKKRVPRDADAGWDFEDIRDHYLKEQFHVDPASLRSWNLPRYVELSRVVPGEMQSAVFSEWRSSHSRCRGGLVWFFKDLLPGGGWGVVDSFGRPKSAYWALKRVWSNRQLVMTDEGINGVDIHLINETTNDYPGT